MKGHSKRHVRFGSAQYATEVLQDEQKRLVCANAKDLASESVVSVLTDVGDDRSHQNGASSPDESENIVR